MGRGRPVELVRQWERRAGQNRRLLPTFWRLEREKIFSSGEKKPGMDKEEAGAAGKNTGSRGTV